MEHQNLLPTLLRGATLAKEAQEARTTAIVYLRKETVARMKTEILGDMGSSGMIGSRMDTEPKTFVELHDYVDANEYGGFCEDALNDAFCSFFGSRNENEGMPDAFLIFMNDCQDDIDEWLKNGRPTT